MNSSEKALEIPVDEADYPLVVAEAIKAVENDTSDIPPEEVITKAEEALASAIKEHSDGDTREAGRMGLKLATYIHYVASVRSAAGKYVFNLKVNRTSDDEESGANKELEDELRRLLGEERVNVELALTGEERKNLMDDMANK